MTNTGSAQLDSGYAWVRLAASLVLTTVGSAGMYVCMVGVPAYQFAFQVERSTASLPYTWAMLGFGVGGIVIGRLVDKYGIVDCGGAEFHPGESHNIKAMVEKPAVGSAPSNQSIIGRYVLPARTMTLLRETRPGAGGEIQLTDAIDALIAEMPVQANSMQGRTYDCGSKLGYLVANLKYGLNHPEIGNALAEWIREQEI